MSDNVTVKRSITINGVTYDSPDAIPADLREQYAPLLKMMAADADNDGIPDFIQHGQAQARRGEPMTEKIAEVRINHNGMGVIVNPEALGTVEIDRSRRVRFAPPSAVPKKDSTVQRHGGHTVKALFLMAVLAFAVLAILGLIFRS